MIDNKHCQDKENSTNSLEFGSFSFSVLTKELVDYATKYLNETEETKQRGLKETREYIRNELRITIEAKDEYLLCFLRSRKFDIKRTCHLIKMLADFAGKYRSLFDRIDPETVQRTVESKIIGFLPCRDSKGRALVFLRSELWDPNEIKMEDMVYGSLVSLHTALKNPVNQITGYVIIMDLNNLTLHQVISVSSWLVFGIQALQRCLPCFVKEIHVTHTPVIFRTVWKIVKPLLSEKIRKRITFYKSTTWDSLHRRIPPAILTEEFGGNLGPYSYEHWASDLPRIQKQYLEQLISLRKLLHDR